MNYKLLQFELEASSSRPEDRLIRFTNYVDASNRSLYLKGLIADLINISWLIGCASLGCRAYVALPITLVAGAFRGHYKSLAPKKESGEAEINYLRAVIVLVLPDSSFTIIIFQLFLLFFR